MERSSTAVRHSSGKAFGALERGLASAGDRRAALAAERQQPDRVHHAGVAVGLAGPGDRDGVDHDVVPLEQVEQGHDVVERQVGVDHDVPLVGVGPCRRWDRRRALGARLTMLPRASRGGSPRSPSAS